MGYKLQYPVNSYAAVKLNVKDSVKETNLSKCS